ncbi:hypothetical protein ADL35_02350 [Streptomyces sp. NRRL WC-3753]|nr:hypothetical protein ADL35_02350 [Streptomyces sp. NRRL WC-3753]
MPEQETPSTEETTTEQPGQTPPDGEQKPAETPEEKPAEEVPAEVLRQKLTEANAEAANYRVKLREVEARFAGAKTPEEFEAAVTELKTQNEALERKILLNTVAAKYELPETLAKRLTGATPEELEADAKELQKLVAAPVPESLGGGLSPSDGDEDFDPVKAARAARQRRY